MTDDKDRDAAAEVLERWIKFRESQGWTREAAKAELATAARALLVAQSRGVSPGIFSVPDGTAKKETGLR
jgi:hypothetical protein